jgi:hypothetical protein
MSYARTLVQDFSTANRLYVNAEVSFYTVDENGEKTGTLATLYSNYTGSTTLANPQTLDSYGKLRQPVYIDTPVIATVEGLGNTPDHDTGVIGFIPIIRGTGTPESAVTASRGTIYLRTDGGANTTLYVKETGDATNTGWVAK